jgi:hypothetical protein
VYPRLIRGAKPKRLSERSVSLKTSAVKDTVVLGMCRRPVAIGYIVDILAMENPGRLELVGKGVYADNADESRLVTRISMAPESEVKVMAGR